MSTAPFAPTPAPFQPLVHAPARQGCGPLLEPDQNRDRTEQSASGDVAARVAERWRNAPSYSDLLRASASAAEQAAAAAEAAAQAARLSMEAARAAAEYDVFTDPFFTEPRPGSEAAVVDGRKADPWWDKQSAPVHRYVLPRRREDAVLPAAQPLHAKLIAFPGELVAHQRQRPRLREGSLLTPAGDSYGREPFPEANGDAHPELGFQSIAARPDALAWSAIRLDEYPTAPCALPVPEADAPALPDRATIADRFKAAIVDALLVGAAFLLSVLVFHACAGQATLGKLTLTLAGLALAAESVLYGSLFMSWGDGSTPGMRWARIALCTFEDENPTRRQLRARVPATALALLPLGLGVLWALLDEERLGWHDRMTRTYQRTYR